MAEKVLVSVESARVQADPPAWHIEYSVHNSGQNFLWLVVDESLVLRQNGARIELSYARARMQPGVAVFGYFNPKVIELPPDGTVRNSIHITWPCQLSDIWNPAREIAPPPGKYEVSVRVGFASTAEPGPPKVGEDVEAAVLRWQKEATSPPVIMEIPPDGATTLIRISL